MHFSDMNMNNGINHLRLEYTLFEKLDLGLYASLRINARDAVGTPMKS